MAEQLCGVPAAAHNYARNARSARRESVHFGPITHIERFVIVHAQVPQDYFDAAWIGLEPLHFGVLCANHNIEEVPYSQAGEFGFGRIIGKHSQPKSKLFQSAQEIRCALTQ